MEAWLQSVGDPALSSPTRAPLSITRRSTSQDVSLSRKSEREAFVSRQAIPVQTYVRRPPGSDAAHDSFRD